MTKKTYPRVYKCLQCNEIVDRAPSHTQTKNVYCNRDCYKKALRSNAELTSNWQERTVKFNCQYCQKSCRRSMNKDGIPKYCSLKCAAVERGLAQRGENHWNWKGGKDSRWIKKVAPRPRPDKCEICSNPGKKRNGICLDHNHQTLKFRGWLCSNCNTIIGLSGENTKNLEAIINYINENSL